MKASSECMSFFKNDSVKAISSRTMETENGRESERANLYKARLPRIALADKWKAPLVEARVFKWHPAQEMVQLIFGDIEFLIQLREQVIDEVSAFLNSFRLCGLPVLFSVLVLFHCLLLNLGVGRVCTEVLQFSLIGGLRSVNEINRCRDIIGPLVDIEIIPTGFRGLFQRGLNANNFATFLCDCIEQPEEQGLPEYESSFSDDSVVYCSPSLAADFSVQISPIVDITSAPTDSVLSSPHQSSTSASSMHFTDKILQGTETAVVQILEPVTATTKDISAQFAQRRDSMSQIPIKQVRTQRSLDDLKSELLFKIDNLVKASTEARDQQTQYIQNSIKSVRQEARTQGDVLSVKLNEYQKGTRVHQAFVTTELADIRNEVKAMDEKLATIRSEMLDLRAQEQENILNLSTQIVFLVDYINRGADAKKVEAEGPVGKSPRAEELLQREERLALGAHLGRGRICMLTKNQLVKEKPVGQNLQGQIVKEDLSCEDDEGQLERRTAEKSKLEELLKSCCKQEKKKRALNGSIMQPARRKYQISANQNGEKLARWLRSNQLR
ncbi:hypothetical protein F511_39326 [Dorcoceras hygrometricum]|uniref:Uncharacterized protein n=1 Tax=Dorcoceras hygrometricum TaxID=472368 RepID=A0A2Z7C091_9LAMI|nr:hypothetical protein F511_39326 [Dorcoceras hygrometricum]